MTYFLKIKTSVFPVLTLLYGDWPRREISRAPTSYLGAHSRTKDFPAL